MSNVLIEKTLDEIKRVEKRTRNLPWLATGVNLKMSVNRNFDLGGRYNASSLENDGGSNRWKPRKKKAIHPLLVKSKDLKLANRVQLIQNGVAVKNTGVAYNAVHNFGYPKKNIPRRPYLVAQDLDIKDLKSMFETHIASGRILSF